MVSVVVPCRNEERALGRCLDALLGGDYPPDRTEILVVDGRSTDRSRDIAAAHAARDPRIRILDNPGITQAAALNIGIRASAAEVIVRMDAHTICEPDYVSRSVAILAGSAADCVGGPQRAVGEGYFGRAVAAAVTSPFGAGDARYRYSERPAWVDTVYLGAWRRRTLLDLGGFDEAASPNEDGELAYRLRASGRRILLSPTIRSHYFVRASLRDLMSQYFRYGRSRVRTLLLHPASVRWRQLVPPAFLLAVVASIPALRISRRPALAAPVAYGVACLLGSVEAARRRGWDLLPALPVVFATEHLSWGAGFWVALLRAGARKA